MLYMTKGLKTQELPTYPTFVYINPERKHYLFVHIVCKEMFSRMQISNNIYTVYFIYTPDRGVGWGWGGRGRVCVGGGGGGVILDSIYIAMILLTPDVSLAETFHLWLMTLTLCGIPTHGHVNIVKRKF